MYRTRVSRLTVLPVQGVAPCLWVSVLRLLARWHIAPVDKSCQCVFALVLVDFRIQRLIIPVPMRGEVRLVHRVFVVRLGVIGAALDRAETVKLVAELADVLGETVNGHVVVGAVRFAVLLGRRWGIFLFGCNFVGVGSAADF